MERIKGTQIDAEVVEAPPEAWEQGLNRQEIEQMEENRLVKKQVHEVRFINLQRHVWTDDESAGGQFTLKALHPLSSVSLEFLQNFGFRSASLPMTPQDSYVLWTKLQQVLNIFIYMHIYMYIIFIILKLHSFFLVLVLNPNNMTSYIYSTLTRVISLIWTQRPSSPHWSPTVSGRNGSHSK
jgi:hypothetical protein